MRLLSINAWHGRGGENFLEFISQQVNFTDIFCFQEITTAAVSGIADDGLRINFLEDLAKLLPEFQYFFVPKYTKQVSVADKTCDATLGKAIFVKRGFKILQKGSAFVHGLAEEVGDMNKKNKPELLQWVKVQASSNELVVATVHGIWYPGDKLDTPERIQQSEKIMSELSHFSCPIILCGDFNLMPETESIKILERSMKNLIKEFGIKNTRNENSWKQFNTKQYFADYTFVSSEIEVKNFQVPYNEVSDHLPMILEFNI